MTIARVQVLKVIVIRHTVCRVAASWDCCSSDWQALGVSVCWDHVFGLCTHDVGSALTDLVVPHLNAKHILDM